MITIAVDAMGGDSAPVPEVFGAVRAARSQEVNIILVGREDAVRQELGKHGDWQSLPIRVVHASEVVTMEDNPAKALRNKRDSSIRVAARLVRDGEAQGLVSAGNTGAVMAISKTLMGMIPGVERPALASAFPTVQGRPVVVVDVGANVDCSPQMLEQFAIMGEIYSRLVYHTQTPRVGILSIGEEEHKGNDLTRAAAQLLKLNPFNFIGNVEGRDLYTGRADVIVCDGFIGNVALKVSEGMVDVFRHMLQESLSATLTRKLGYLLSRAAYKDFKKRVDYSEYGGAPLLGVKGVVIICHGRSNDNAIRNAIRVACESANEHVNDRIAAEIVRSRAQDGLATSA
ncbi:MAG: phosphate acyltransferase PlsX [Bryobacteraceae bacterium]|jgi:glycerol-3-phosphate acyltransferase PlsX|nr:phosphate acyltransferase PlsX [Bryobacteraceae bacterium]